MKRAALMATNRANREVSLEIAMEEEMDRVPLPLRAMHHRFRMYAEMYDPTELWERMNKVEKEFGYHLGVAHFLQEMVEEFGWLDRRSVTSPSLDVDRLRSTLTDFLHSKAMRPSPRAARLAADGLSLLSRSIWNGQLLAVLPQFDSTSYSGNGLLSPDDCIGKVIASFLDRFGDVPCRTYSETLECSVSPQRGPPLRISSTAQRSGREWRVRTVMVILEWDKEHDLMSLLSLYGYAMAQRIANCAMRCLVRLCVTSALLSEFALPTASTVVPPLMWSGTLENLLLAKPVELLRSPEMLSTFGTPLSDGLMGIELEMRSSSITSSVVLSSTTRSFDF